MELDMVWVAQCDAVYRLPGASTGADMELELAHKLNIPVFHGLRELEEWRLERDQIQVSSESGEGS